MARPSKTWGQYSRTYRDRATKQAAQYGLSRRSAREMFNRGTFKPFVKEPAHRVPQKIVKQQARQGPSRDVAALSDSTVRAGILAKVDFQLSSARKYTPSARSDLGDYLGELTRAQLDVFENALDKHSVRELASAQKRSDLPKEIRSMFKLKDSSGKFYNPFWYHPTVGR